MIKEMHRNIMKEEKLIESIIKWSKTKREQ
jgi:hypothetical protein